MRKWLISLWSGEAGSLEVDWLVIASVLLLGAIAGLAASHTASNAEFQAVTALVQDR